VKPNIDELTELENRMVVTKVWGQGGEGGGNGDLLTKGCKLSNRQEILKSIV
jgi:hypothetical protein